jgi:hypothetical protein
MVDIIEIYISYAHEDEELLRELEKHLKPLERKGRIRLWDSRSIRPGMVSAQEIDKHLSAAHIMLLLISSNYIASTNYSYEVTKSMKRQRAGEVHLIPIILAPIYWQDEPYGKLEPLPDNRKPVTNWQDRGQAFFNVAEGVRKVVDELSAHLSPEMQAPSELVMRTKIETLGSSLIVEESTVSKTQPENFDAFMSHSHRDADWVEKLAERLEDEHGLTIWLDKWIIVPGQPFQQAMARGIEQAKCCIVCISEHTPDGWFKREIEKALHRQTHISSFGVIPVLLPNAKSVNVNDFLELNSRVDFRDGRDPAEALYRLACGVKGIPPGRWPPRGSRNQKSG